MVLRNGWCLFSNKNYTEVVLMCYSERKWKEKIKEWKLTKKVPTKDMSIMVAKAEKRKIDQGKDTLFHHNGIKVAHHKIEKIKKERVSQSQNVTSSIPGKQFNVNSSTLAIAYLAC